MVVRYQYTAVFTSIFIKRYRHGNSTGILKKIPVPLPHRLIKIPVISGKTVISQNSLE